jgi:hypothetical protein
MVEIELKDRLLAGRCFHFNENWVYTMVRKKIFIQYLLVVLITFLFVPACSGTSKMENAPSKAVCRSIVDSKCVKCHYKTRICNALGTKSIRKWKQTVKFMIRLGADLTEDEINKVIDCLSSLPEGSDAVCQ